MKDRNSLLLVGAGPMAQAYAKVLRDLREPYMAVCRSTESARKFTDATGGECRDGGLDRLLRDEGLPAAAIVALPVADLAKATELLIDAGCRKILVEKPAGTTPAEVSRVARRSHSRGAHVHVAYNRRFYESVRTAHALITEDGGPVSFTFEFSEVADRVAQLPYPREVLENWDLANSTHVIDTAFFLAGTPIKLEATIGGSLPWHPRAARYFGHGETETGAMFSYSADWDAPGRWGIEINTRQRRLVLRPMEQLQVQKRGTFALEPVALNDRLDRDYKPGLYRQTRAWLTGEDAGSLLEIQTHAAKLSFIATRMLAHQPQRELADAP